MRMGGVMYSIFASIYLSHFTFLANNMYLLIPLFLYDVAAQVMIVMLDKILLNVSGGNDEICVKLYL